MGTGDSRYIPIHKNRVEQSRKFLLACLSEVWREGNIRAFGSDIFKGESKTRIRQCEE